MKYAVWYMKPEFFRDGLMGHDFLKEKGLLPDPTNLSKTHVHLTNVDAEIVDGVFIKMQGEVWSPNGEARDLIQSKGLAHTSMSVGDIAKAEDGTVYMVDNFGWEEL